MRRNLLSLSLLSSLLFVAVSCNQTSSQIPTSQTQVVIGNKVLDVEIADSDGTRTKGLSGRDSLSENSGMLFILPMSGTYTFWMKDTHFPLDFIWIKDGKVIEITSNVSVEHGVPDNLLKRYSSKEEVNWVLEVNAGWAAKNSIKIGDEVHLTQ